MNIKFINISKSLKKAYLKQDITAQDFGKFKTALNEFFNNHNTNESEEHQKNNIADLLKNGFYKDSNLINTKGRIDLAIYNGNSSNNTVGVLIEVKSTKNKNEMMTQAKPNTKALQEAVSYYLEESITNRNKEIKNIIITNSEDWFIFDGAEFERAFFKNSYLNKYFALHREDLFGAHTTEWFYTFLRDEILPKIDGLNCTYFNLYKYKDNLDNPEYIDELINLFKVLSPEHLLNKPFANDINTLDTQFYDELLHLIGLEEVKDFGKKVLLRLPENKRNDGSMLENTIRILKVNSALDNVKNIKEFGENEEQQLFSISLELCITWLNRILFLKLLESQLIKYNDNDFSYKFLSFDKIEDYDELNELFFEVLALKTNERAKQDQDRFAKIPYLNSSLFEQTQLEKETINISTLKDRLTIPIYSKTVLKNLSGDKRTGDLKFQEYLFDFLDAYNFASVSKASIQESSKTIINSSVLGLIFEKLNGYKDGSYFTPGYITMYMCREAISLAVVSKFNEKYSWNCNTLTDVHNKLETDTTKLLEYNEVMNSIRLVDPAVGSGHFLVSALNEFINIKSELGILIDKSGKRLKEYKVYVENDELIIVDDDDNIFSYLSPDKAKGSKRDQLQRVQSTIFHEKQNIIENCLFGVDINPKSVSISRLRLWVELLKFMYYKPNENGNYELETLPNIDINIKTGNSLISRFPIDDNALISIADSKVIPLYKNAVNKYKNVKNAEGKKNILKEIENYKLQLKGVMTSKSNKILKLNENKEELKTLISQTDLFNEFKSKKEEKEFTDKVNKLTQEIQKLKKEVDELSNNPVYHNAFEWRFEFPEVLDNKGNFIGFDVVIGNPPYVQLQKAGGKLAAELENLNFVTFTKTGDIYALFYEKGINLLKNEGNLTFITSNKWMRAGYGEKLREFFTKYDSKILIDLGPGVFESATVDTNILLIEKNINSNNLSAVTLNANSKGSIDINSILKNDGVIINKLTKDAWTISGDIEMRIKEKIERIGTPLKDWDINIYRGVLTGFNEAFIIDDKKKDELIAQDPKSAEIIKPILRGRDIKRYKAEFADLWLINSHNGIKEKGIQRINIEKHYPAVYNHLKQYETQLIKRQDKGDHWTNLRNCAYLEEFEKEKVVYPETTQNNNFIIDNGYYFVEKTSFIMVGNHLKFLLSIFNSTFFKNIYPMIFSSIELGKSGFQYNKFAFEKFPIPFISPENQLPFIDLVDIILKKKENNEDTTAEERQIDIMVYKLYELTEEEIAIIEGNSHGK